MITTKISTKQASAIKTDALVVGLREVDGTVKVAPTKNLSGADLRVVKKALDRVGAQAAAESISTIPAPDGFAAEVIVAVGLGPARPDLGPLEVLRRAAGAAARASQSSPRVTYALPMTTPAEVAAVAEGALLGAYDFNQFRQTTAKEVATATVDLAYSGSVTKAVRAAVDRARVVCAAVSLTRDLVNTPSGSLRPSQFAALATKRAEDLGLQVNVLAGAALLRKGYGGITAVGQGSSDGPRLVHIAYRHPKATKSLALIGKGITFDSGGLSIKPAKSMETMKMDMAGAAAVLGTLLAVGELKPVVNVDGWLPLAENMPSGTAQRPGDVISMFGGTTVEVLNTDAEGRLVMADALARAAQDEPDVMLDIATLTGAQMVALGPRVAGVMGNGDAIRNDVVRIGGEQGESLWGMPLPSELRPALKSPIADLANIGGPHGGMLTAGIFLSEFVPDEIPWAHLDIAGPAYNESGPHDYTPKGATGFGVRTLVAVAEAIAAGDLP